MCSEREVWGRYSLQEHEHRDKGQTRFDSSNTEILLERKSPAWDSHVIITSLWHGVVFFHTFSLKNGQTGPCCLTGG